MRTAFELQQQNIATACLLMAYTQKERKCDKKHTTPTITEYGVLIEHVFSCTMSALHCIFVKYSFHKFHDQIDLFFKKKNGLKTAPSNGIKE